MGFSFKADLRIGVSYDKEAEVFVGYCPVLDIYSQGETNESAIKATQSAISLFLVECFKRNILQEVLRQRGLTRIENIEAAPVEEMKSEFIAFEKSDSYADIEVPIHFRKDSNTCQPCQV